MAGNSHAPLPRKTSRWDSAVSPHRTRHPSFHQLWEEKERRMINLLRQIIGISVYLKGTFGSLHFLLNQFYLVWQLIILIPF